jgi:hypothetical protein
MCNIGEIHNKYPGCLAMIALNRVMGSARTILLEGTCMAHIGAFGLSSMSIEHKFKGRRTRRFILWPTLLSQAEIIIE